MTDSKRATNRGDLIERVRAIGERHIRQAGYLEGNARQEARETADTMDEIEAALLAEPEREPDWRDEVVAPMYDRGFHDGFFAGQKSDRTAPLTRRMVAEAHREMRLSATTSDRPPSTSASVGDGTLDPNRTVDLSVEAYRASASEPTCSWSVTGDGGFRCVLPEGHNGLHQVLFGDDEQASASEGDEASEALDWEAFYDEVEGVRVWLHRKGEHASVTARNVANQLDDAMQKHLAARHPTSTPEEE